MSIEQEFSGKSLKKQESDIDLRSLKDTECKHHFWLKRCSICKTILESDSQINYESGMQAKEIYSDFDVLVCSYKIARKLQEAKLTQRSKFYWVLNVSTNFLTLKSKENVSLKGTLVTSAFTSSELARAFYRIPKHLQTRELFEELGRHAYDPSSLAKLLLKHMK